MQPLTRPPTIRIDPAGSYLEEGVIAVATMAVLSLALAGAYVTAASLGIGHPVAVPAALLVGFVIAVGLPIGATVTVRRGRARLANRQSRRRRRDARSVRPDTRLTRR